MVSALCFSPAAEDSRAGSIPVQPWSLCEIMLNAQIQLDVQKSETKTSLRTLMIFIRFEFTQTTHV